MTTKADLDAIWASCGVANNCNLTGWLDKAEAQQRKLGFYDVDGLMPYKGRKLNPRLISRKAEIFKHQMLG